MNRADRAELFWGVLLWAGVTVFLGLALWLNLWTD